MDKLLVPLVTPFTDDTTALSEVRLARLVRHHIDHGAAGFVVCTEAGEVHALSLSERKQLVEWLVREAKDTLVYVNVSASTTATVVDLAQHAERHGAHAGVFTSPKQLALNNDETAAFISAVRRYGNLPCGFLDPWNPDLGSVGVMDVKSLKESGMESYALYQTVSPEEFVSEDLASTPLAVLGADKAKLLMDNWAECQTKVHGVFAYGRSFRVGKAAMILSGLDVGHTRGPAHDLDGRGVQVLESLMSWPAAA